MNVYELISKLEVIIRENPDINFNIIEISLNGEYSARGAGLDSWNSVTNGQLQHCINIF